MNPRVIFSLYCMPLQQLKEEDSLALLRAWRQLCEPVSKNDYVSPSPVGTQRLKSSLLLLSGKASGRKKNPSDFSKIFLTLEVLFYDQSQKV